MIHEFALEPEWVAELPNDRAMAALVKNSFELHSGRIVSQFPRKWKTLVWDKYTKTGTPRDTMMAELLARLTERKLIRPGVRWQEGRSWMENLEPEHAVRPFHGVIACEPNPGIDRLLLPQDLIAGNAPHWVCETGQTIPSRLRKFPCLLRPVTLTEALAAR